MERITGSAGILAGGLRSFVDKRAGKDASAPDWVKSYRESETGFGAYAHA